MTRRRRRRGEEDGDIEHRLDSDEVEEEYSEDLAGQVNDLERKTDDVLSKVGLALADIRIIGDKVKRFEDVISDVNELADELDEKLEKLDVTEAKLDKIISEGDLIKSRTARLEESGNSLIEAIEELKKGGVPAGEGGAGLSPEQAEQIQQMSQQFESLSSQMSALTEHIKEFVSMEEFTGLKDQLTQQSDDLGELRGIIDELKEAGAAPAAEGAEQVEGGVKNRLDELQALIEEKEKLMQDSINEINDRIEQDLAEIAPLIEKVSESAGANVKEVSERINALEQKLNALSENVQIDDLVKKIDAISSTINVEEIAGKITTLTVRIEENEADIDERLNSLNETLGTEISQALQATLDENLKLSSEKLDEMNVRVNEVTQELSRVKQSAEGVLEKQDSGIGALREEFNKAFEEHKTEVRGFNDKLQSLVDGSEGINKIIEESEKKVGELSTNMKTALENYERLAGSMADTMAKSELNLEKVNVAFRLVEDIEDKIRRIASPVEELIERIEGFEDLPEIEDLGFDLNDLLNVMIKHQASDLHIKEGSPPTVRLEGDLVPVGDKLLTDVDCRFLVLSSLSKSQRRRLLEKKEMDYAYAIPEGRFRVNAFLQKGTVSAAFRMLKTEIPTIEDLNLPPFLKKLASINHGLILVTGPAGCGKSTTLASMIDHINTNKKLHIITIEDPIEFVHHDKLSIVTQRELGSDTTTFQDALKSSLRQDPNVILIGEMRDAETILTAAIAAETGHLVFSTLHTPNTTQAVERIIDVFSGDQQKQFRLLLSTTLRSVISQRLLSRIDAEGRVPATEIMIVTPTVSSLILEGKTNEIYPLMVQGATEGMQTFTASLTRLYEAGMISKEDALYHADQPTEFRLGIEGHTSGSASIPEDSLMSWL